MAQEYLTKLRELLLVSNMIFNMNKNISNIKYSYLILKHN